MKMNYYHKLFLASFTSENIIALFSKYPNAYKEITESWGMLEAAKKFFPNLNNYIIIIVGDGGTPRTGAIFAYYTKAEVITIDPCFNLDFWKEHVKKQTAMGFPPQRIQLIKDKIENLEIDCNNKSCILIWPHSHADMNKVNLKNCLSRSDIALPCCVKIPKNWKERPHITYIDKHILSAKNMLHIWKPEL